MVYRNGAAHADLDRHGQLRVVEATAGHLRRHERTSRARRTRYTIKVTDGTNTSAASAAVSATAPWRPPSSYAATVRADNPTMDLSGRNVGTWVQDVGASTTDNRRLSGIGQMGITTSADSPIADGSGSMSFDGIDDYIWNDEYVQAPDHVLRGGVDQDQHSTKGGKIIGYGNGRPRTDTCATQLSSSYDRQLYMDSGSRVRLRRQRQRQRHHRPAQPDCSQRRPVAPPRRHPGCQRHGPLRRRQEGRRPTAASPPARATRASGTSAATTCGSLAQQAQQQLLRRAHRRGGGVPDRARPRSRSSAHFKAAGGNLDRQPPPDRQLRRRCLRQRPRACTGA